MIKTDVVIVGAGPTGLFQVFELGLLGIKAHVVETLDQPGGQCTELYPDKPIYDIPALPEVGAQQLIDNLLRQIKPFDPVFHFGQQVIDVVKTESGRFHVLTTTGTEFDTGAVVIASGAGSFEPVPLKIPGVEPLLDKDIFYSVKNPELHHDKELVILGGGDSALDWALELRKTAESVLLIHRSERFKASAASVQQMQSHCDNLEMQFLSGNVTALETSNDHLSSIDITSLDGVKRKVTLDHLLVFFGLSPKPGPIANWGLDSKGKSLLVDTEKFQTSIEGIFAVGDNNWYPGKKKLILSGFHEAALAAFAIKSFLQPDKKVSLQYTTTSPLMHDRLGVDDPYKTTDEVAA